MATSLTGLGLVWAALSLISALMACTGFYLPLWVTGTLLNRTETSFGSFRRCNYPQQSEMGTIVIVEECGRYTTFADIPSVSWQICTVLAGSGCALALLVAFTACLACCMTDVINKPTAKIAGVIQGVAALLIAVGCAIYPNGWHSQEVRDVCGSTADAFSLGSCSLSWSFYILTSSVAATIVCVLLSFHASRVKRGSFRL